MIQVLARFNKQTAVLLYMIFYMQLLASADAYTSYRSIPGSPRSISRKNIYEAGSSRRTDQQLAEEKKNILSGKVANNDSATINYPLLKTASKNNGPGPGQPEMSSFQSVNATDMVDPFTGDFSYNIPLLDVGGYPINISYKSGITMDQEASWVGLGWNINPGAIERNMRGVPDDFNGEDTITKTQSVQDNKTIGGRIGADVEILGLDVTHGGDTGDQDTAGHPGKIGLDLGAQLGFFHNTYKGWGSEFGLDASISAGEKGLGSLTGGLGLTNNSQDGVTIDPSLSVSTKRYETDKQATGGVFSISAPYNTRAGLQGLQLSVGVRQYKRQNSGSAWKREGVDPLSGTISFCSPSFTPDISIPYTSKQATFTGKLGTEIFGFHGSVFASGYVTDQYIAPEDQTAYMPVYGYLHYQDGAANTGALTDFNTEKEIAYREDPPVPAIGLPSYTYDVFSITGEGTGGMFRAYRSDLGYVYNHFMRTKDASQAFSVDLGFGNGFHAGVDLNMNRTVTTTGPWLDNNPAARNLAFRQSDSTFEAAYFRNPGEMAMNTSAFYDAVGNEDVVSLALYQNKSDLSTILGTNALARLKNGLPDTILFNQNLLKRQRDKRKQVISYLTAEEAQYGGLSKYIENYGVNQFGLDNCHTGMADLSTTAGLMGIYYNDLKFQVVDTIRIDSAFIPNRSILASITHSDGQYKAVRWIGRIKAPETGRYEFNFNSDDGAFIWINDSLCLNDGTDHPAQDRTFYLNLVGNTYYNIRIDYHNAGGPGSAILEWKLPGASSFYQIPSRYLSVLPPDSFRVNDALLLEKRTNSFRKSGHISEVDVLNPDGRRYVYGIPVYNLSQKDYTFSVDSSRTNLASGRAWYHPGTDNTVYNAHGIDHYFSEEQTPAYAHSFLLTAILSSDYTDLTGNGVSDDDLGDAIQFKYSKVCGIGNPYPWRAPYDDSVSYNEGLKSYDRDDKGSYSSGTKELWYLHSVESKNMIATFTLSDREDELGISEDGQKDATHHLAKKLSEINLYNKTDFLKNGTHAVPVKTVHFGYSYELCRGMNLPENDSGKLTLKKIWFTYNGNDKGVENPYVFYYHSNNPRYNTASYDRWGNYKDPLQNPLSSSDHLLTNADYPYALQDSAQAAYNVAAWTLTSVKLPSGGSIKVEYESDDYAYVQNKRAMQLFRVVGFSSDGQNSFTPELYQSSGDNLYVYVRVADASAQQQEALNKYLEDVDQLYFKVAVRMPRNEFNAYAGDDELVPGYATIDKSGSNWYYALPNTNIIRLKLKGIDNKGHDGSYSPIAQAANQFLRLNLPSKAYPGSEGLHNDVVLQEVEMIIGNIPLIMKQLTSFSTVGRANGWAQWIDTTRSYVRLDNPYYKKYGGGSRVKRLMVYDNWNAMTGQSESVYGQEYGYTTTKEINGTAQTISSGVASYEPMIGNEENPFHQPMQYSEQVAPLAPVTLGYIERPVGETFYPSPNVGYSKVSIRTIHYKGKRSANGYDEKEFYTTCDFPTITDNSAITSFRYKPGLSNLLRINAQHHLVVSQGFKVELNDMDGKLKSEASYAETDPVNPVSYTRNYYKVDDPFAYQQHLSNKAWTVNEQGIVDTTAVIGENIDLMTSLREENSQVNGCNISPNSDMMNIPAFPFFLLIPSSIFMPQHEETIYRAAAMTKVIQRYGILDSVVHVDKGSKIATENMLYDSETGDALLTRTRNEFNDTLYNFNYPAHWAYDGMAGAYKNIDLVLGHLTIRNGKIVYGLPYKGADTNYFRSGDELLVQAHVKVGGTDCKPDSASFGNYIKLWAINPGELNGGEKSICFIDEDGQPFTGNNVTLKVIRSGRRNMAGSVGSVTTLTSPLRKDTSGNYRLTLDDSSQVLNASAAEYQQLWRVPEMKVSKDITTCFDTVTYSNDTTIRICNGASYNWYDSVITQSGTYEKHFTGVSGGDSTRTLYLVIDSAKHTDTTATACDHFFWYGKEYTRSGDYTILNYRPSGCADTATLHLTIHGVDRDTFCYYDRSQHGHSIQAASHTYNGYTLTTSYIQSYNYTNPGQPIERFYESDSAGCGGIDSLYWYVLPIHSQDIHIKVGCGETNPPNYTYSWTDGADSILAGFPITGEQIAIVSNVNDSNACPIVKNLYIDSAYNKIKSTHTSLCDGQDINMSNGVSIIATPDGCGWLDSSWVTEHFTGHNYYVTLPLDVPGYSWPLHGLYFDYSQQYIVKSPENPNDPACRDTLTLNALVYARTINITACHAYTWLENLQTYTTDTVAIYGYIDTARHVDTLRLTIRNDFADTATYDTACINTYYQWKGFSYLSNFPMDTIYVGADTITGGCIRIDTLHLHFKDCGGAWLDKAGSEYVSAGHLLKKHHPEHTGWSTLPEVDKGKLEDAIGYCFRKYLGPRRLSDLIITTICNTTQICYNPLLDSTINPYRFGLLGNFRANRSYVYYSTRKETDPLLPTNIRKDGTYKTFAPFWTFTPAGMQPQYDTSRWVWNSELTMVNDKGLEIENKDPLGRYNAGLYGYGKTLPVAVIQNSRYQENAFEGFEDYDYVGDRCDTACQPARHWDFSNYISYLDTTEAHTGRYSLRIDPAAHISSLGISANVAPAPDEQAGLTFADGIDSCDTTGQTQVLKSIKATANIVLPNFQPLPGKKMVFSAWVKEDSTCNCQSYANNEVDLVTADGSGVKLDSIAAHPAGNIIEGWQRYEVFFTVPEQAATFTLLLKATGSRKVYFDDLRLHPFNAEMKSFVFHTVNLRLMAELDENNYATFYEYDDDGTLIRVKKETERGIMTIQETRSALYKDQ